MVIQEFLITGKIIADSVDKLTLPVVVWLMHLFF